MSEDVLGVWTFDRDTPGTTMVVIAQDRLIPPAFGVRLIASRGDSIRVQAGNRPRIDPDAVLYVERRGTYELARRETWSNSQKLLLLAAWPRR